MDPAQVGEVGCVSIRLAIRRKSVWLVPEGSTSRVAAGQTIIRAKIIVTSENEVIVIRLIGRRSAKEAAGRTSCVRLRWVLEEGENVSVGRHGGDRLSLELGSRHLGRH